MKHEPAKAPSTCDFSLVGLNLADRLEKRAEQIGYLLVDPPRPHPDAKLMREAAAAIYAFYERQKTNKVAENGEMLMLFSTYEIGSGGPVTEYEYKKYSKESVSNLKFECVTWRDSRGVGPSWQRVEDIEDQTPCTILSVGWVIQETDTYLHIAPHVGIEQKGDHQVCGDMIIPVSAIVDRREIYRYSYNTFPADTFAVQKNS